MIEYKSPNSTPLCRIFLAGSIELGNAWDWQKQVTNDLSEESCTILNPRRDDWDNSWEQKISNPKFYEQVSWELDALEKSDIIYMYLCENTKSPISLMELGLFARQKKLIVCCEPKFWRRGNVEIVCCKYEIPFYTDYYLSMKFLKHKIKLTCHYKFP